MIAKIESAVKAAEQRALRAGCEVSDDDLTHWRAEATGQALIDLHAARDPLEGELADRLRTHLAVAGWISPAWIADLAGGVDGVSALEVLTLMLSEGGVVGDLVSGLQAAGPLAVRPVAAGAAGVQLVAAGAGWIVDEAARVWWQARAGALYAGAPLIERARASWATLDGVAAAAAGGDPVHGGGGLGDVEGGVRCVARGVDTIELSVRYDGLAQGVPASLRRVRSLAEREGRDQLVYLTGGVTVSMQAWAPRGATWLLTGAACDLYVSARGARVVVRAEVLWAMGVREAVELVLAALRPWISGLQRVDVSRIDLAADVSGAGFGDTMATDLQSGAWMSRARRRSIFGVGERDKEGDGRVVRTVSTGTLEESARWAAHYYGRDSTGLVLGGGSPLSARIYDKTREIEVKGGGKRWFYDIWARGGWDVEKRPPVWRVEFQLRGEALSALLAQRGADGGVLWGRDLGGVLDRLPALWGYLTGGDHDLPGGGAGWLSLRVPGADRTRARWSVDPRWAVVRSVGWGEAARWTVRRVGRDVRRAADRARAAARTVGAEALEGLSMIIQTGSASLGELSSWLKLGVGDLDPLASGLETRRAIEVAASLGAQVRGVMASYVAALSRTVGLPDWVDDCGENHGSLMAWAVGQAWDGADIAPGAAVERARRRHGLGALRAALMPT